MSEQDWEQSFARCLGVLLSGRGLTERDERGQPIEDDDLLLMLNAHHDEIAFALPGKSETQWEALLDTGTVDGKPGLKSFRSGASYPLQGRSLALLASRRNSRGSGGVA
jgi:glycogen operon protein